MYFINRSKWTDNSLLNYTHEGINTKNIFFFFECFRLCSRGIARDGYVIEIGIDRIIERAAGMQVERVSTATAPHPLSRATWFIIF